MEKKELMTREELNELLKEYARSAYWYGEDIGNYGEQDPEVHKEIESKIWKAICKGGKDAS